jgi:hypothetical protein
MTKDSIWNTARDQGMEHTLTREESRRVQKGQTREQIVYDRFWRLRPDGIAVRLTTETETGVFCILEYKHMSDVTDQYLLRARHKINTSPSGETSETRYISKDGPLRTTSKMICIDF